MRFRSEWLTMFTLTALVGGGLVLPRADGVTPVSAKRGDIAASGIDYMPIGTARAIAKAKLLRAKP